MNWQQVLEDKSLRNLPYKIELNKQGQIVMSPVKPRHSRFQGEIIALLRKLKPEGTVLSEPAIETSDNVKAADAAWMSDQRFSQVSEETACSIAPEICIEVLSDSNTGEEMRHKMELYFEKGAIECWLCDATGGISFHDKRGKIAASLLVPSFPNRVEI